MHWDELEGWYREGGGSGVQDGEHAYAHGGFMLMCGRTIQYCKVKNKQTKKKQHNTKKEFDRTPLFMI